MTNLVDKLINYSIFFAIIFIINSCAHFRIVDLEKNNFLEKSLYQLISLEYLQLAKYELYEMHDEIDANLFSYKSSISINRKIFYPENPKHWDIPTNYIDTANMLFEKVNNLIKEESYLEFPEEFSKVLTAYDCWIEQVEENWQTEHIETCYNKLEVNFKTITNKSSSINKKNNIISEKKDNIGNQTPKKTISQENKGPPEPKRNTNDYTEVYETKVFFAFDKFNLSSEQIIQLEQFINTALANKNMTIFIEGHTDTMGSKIYNINLSQKRANFVKRYLLKRSLVNTIEIKAYGENQPLVFTNDEVKEKKNRRAEIYLK